ncbi:protein NRT1/ PTR FAMILY 5.1 [Cajanus cajan]|uniref:Peptide transporter PTR3-A n=1 Tax=Cajanus cajan TaxID=3821 RepID=A0A151TR16_CAJCA|nr:protein NRT1/ PTR FAMILY 5.1 [Cajanus cajan]KYP69471.1 Peptide transporter PTR3-A [Cajanus cajan]
MEDRGYTLDGTVDLSGRPVLSSSTGKRKACAFILAYQAFERFAYFGVSANLVIYMTSELHKDLVSSVTGVNYWSGTAWITPVLGAYLADSFLGRFWTITFALLIYAIGMGLLVITTSLRCFRTVCTNGICREASSLRQTLFYLSIYTIAIGSGVLKPNMSTFGADQFDDFKLKEKELKVSFFNWWSFNTSCGTLAATLFVVYIQERFGWGLGYGISSIGFMLASFTFFMGVPIYRHKSRQGKSHAEEFFRVPVVAFRNRKLQLPSSPSELHELELEHYNDSGKRQIYHTPRFRFLDKAAIKESKEGTTNPPCTVSQVETNKLILGMLVIWLLIIIPSNFWAVEVTVFVKQGTTMERNLGPNFKIPAASLWSFVVATMLICLPIYDHYFVPFMRRRTGYHRGIKMLQRIGIGVAIQVIAAAVMYAVEILRMNVIKKKHIVGAEEIVPMSIFWLLPQHVLLGFANTFLMAGLLEFFYDQSPEEMKVLGTAFYTSTIAAGKYSNSLLVTAIDKFTRKISGKSWIGNNLNDCHLDYYYALLFVISALNFGVFLWVSSGYVYKKESTTKVNDIEILREMQTETLVGKA